MTMQCKNVSQLLMDYLKCELPLAESAQMKAHLTACDHCSEELRILRNACREFDRLPVFHVSYDPAAIAEAARRPQSRLSEWFNSRARVPAFGAAMLLLVVAGLLQGHWPAPSPQIARQAPLPPRIVASTPSVKPTIKQIPPQVNHPSATPHVAVVPRPRIIARVIRPAVLPPAARPSNSVATPMIARPAAPVQQAHLPAKHLPAAGELLLAQHFDAVTESMKNQIPTGAKLSCAVLPVVAGNPDDLATADTLTAALVCGLGERNTQAVVHPLSPMMPSDQSVPSARPDAPDITRIARTVTDDFLVTGSVEKGKEGYLLSIYVLKRKDNTVVFDGDHPVLLPRDLFLAPSARQIIARLITLHPRAERI